MRSLIFIGLVFCSTFTYSQETNIPNSFGFSIGTGVTKPVYHDYWPNYSYNYPTQIEDNNEILDQNYQGDTIRYNLDDLNHPTHTNLFLSLYYKTHIESGANNIELESAISIATQPKNVFISEEIINEVYNEGFGSLYVKNKTFSRVILSETLKYRFDNEHSLGVGLTLSFSDFLDDVLSINSEYADVSFGISPSYGVLFTIPNTNYNINLELKAIFDFSGSHGGSYYNSIVRSDNILYNEAADLKLYYNRPYRFSSIFLILSLEIPDSW